MTPTFLGYGLGLRPPHYNTILAQLPKAIDWFEIISEDYMVPGGRPLHFLDKVREHYPIVMHGVSLSIGSCDPIDKEYLKKLKTLMTRINPPWVSDHLCWTGTQRKNMHDLLPLPYTEESLHHVAHRLKQVQDYLGRQILLENPSTYLTFEESEIPEPEFLRELTQMTDCYLLLDINNIYVNSFNHQFDPEEYLYQMPKDRVVQFHLAGHDNCGTHIIDTHDHPIITPVWDLFAKAVKHFGPVSTMIERDDNIPPLPELLEELARVKEIAMPHWQQEVSVS